MPHNFFHFLLAFSLLKTFSLLIFFYPILFFSILFYSHQLFSFLAMSIILTYCRYCYYHTIPLFANSISTATDLRHFFFFHPKEWYPALNNPTIPTMITHFLTVKKTPDFLFNFLPSIFTKKKFKKNAVRFEQEFFPFLTDSSYLLLYMAGPGLSSQKAPFKVF
jgi:hypothetical protein